MQPSRRGPRPHLRATRTELSSGPLLMLSPAEKELSSPFGRCSWGAGERSLAALLPSVPPSKAPLVILSSCCLLWRLTAAASSSAAGKREEPSRRASRTLPGRSAPLSGGDTRALQSPPSRHRFTPAASRTRTGPCLRARGRERANQRAGS